MTAISVLPLEPRAYAVRITEGDVETDHKVTVPQRVLDDLGPDVDEDALVRASIEFLLERELATSTLADFSLDVMPATLTMSSS